MGNGEPKEDYTNPRNIASVVRQLRAQSGELDAALLRPCREVELSAFDSRTGTLMDRMTGGKTAAMKRFVKRNRACRFTLRIVAEREEAQSIIAALGFPAYYEDVKGAATAFIKELPGRVREPVCFHCPDAEVYSWPGVSVTFGCDSGGRATIRCALVILMVSAAPHTASRGADNPAPRQQLGLGF